MALIIPLFEILLAIICFLILRYITTKTNGVPKNWPVVGMLPELLLRLYRVHDWITEVLERSQCTFVFKGPWFANMDMLVTANPANIHYIMSSNFSNFPKGPEFKKVFDVLGDGIFNSDLDMWKSQRKIARALINHQRFHTFLGKTSWEKVENGLIPVLKHVSEQGLELDLQDLFQRFTFDSTCILVTGYDPKSLSIDFSEVPFSKALDDAEEAIFYRHAVSENLWKLQRWLGIGQEKKMRKAKETFDRTIGNYISRKRDELSKATPIRHSEDSIDLLTSYMTEDENLEIGPNDDKFFRDTILNLMIAGRDTTSSALTWFFWLVSTNPEVETKIRQELQSKAVVIPKKGGETWRYIDLQDLNMLVYLHAAICESLRLYPPVPFQHKAPLSPDTLPSGHRVEPGTKILFNLYSLGRMRSVWGEDSFEFKPERWITERGGIKHEPSYKFLAFNAGPRTCLGKEVAFTQIKTVASTIMLNYNVQLVKEHRVGPCASIILHMKYGLKVTISKRSSA